MNQWVTSSRDRPSEINIVANKSWRPSVCITRLSLHLARGRTCCATVPGTGNVGTRAGRCVHKKNCPGDVARNRRNCTSCGTNIASLSNAISLRAAARLCETNASSAPSNHPKATWLVYEVYCGHGRRQEPRVPSHNRPATRLMPSEGRFGSCFGSRRAKGTAQQMRRYPPQCARDCGRLARIGK